jgi:hypothetical protein
VPVTVRLSAGEPAAAEFGLSEVSVGVGFEAGVIVKATAAELPPPGAGLLTVIDALPAACRSPVLTCAVSDVALLYVVGRAAPFHIAVDDEMKFVPVSVIVTAAEPADAEAGLIDVSVGAGFDWAGFEEPLLPDPPDPPLELVPPHPAMKQERNRTLAASNSDP